MLPECLQPRKPFDLINEVNKNQLVEMGAKILSVKLLSHETTGREIVTGSGDFTK